MCVCACLRVCVYVCVDPPLVILDYVFFFEGVWQMKNASDATWWSGWTALALQRFTTELVIHNFDLWWFVMISRFWREGLPNGTVGFKGINGFKTNGAVHWDLGFPVLRPQLWKARRCRRWSEHLWRLFVPGLQGPPHVAVKFMKPEILWICWFNARIWPHCPTVHFQIFRFSRWREITSDPASRWSPALKPLRCWGAGGFQNGSKKIQKIVSSRLPSWQPFLSFCRSYDSFGGILSHKTERKFAWNWSSRALCGRPAWTDTPDRYS